MSTDSKSIKPGTLTKPRKKSVCIWPSDLRNRLQISVHVFYQAKLCELSSIPH